MFHFSGKCRWLTPPEVAMTSPSTLLSAGESTNFEAKVSHYVMNRHLFSLLSTVKMREIQTLTDC